MDREVWTPRPGLPCFRCIGVLANFGDDSSVRRSNASHEATARTTLNSNRRHRRCRGPKHRQLSLSLLLSKLLCTSSVTFVTPKNTCELVDRYRGPPAVPIWAVFAILPTTRCCPSDIFQTTLHCGFSPQYSRTHGESSSNTGASCRPAQRRSCSASQSNVLRSSSIIQSTRVAYVLWELTGAIASMGSHCFTVALSHNVSIR